LTTLEGQHRALAQLYESLQLVYSSVTEQLGTLQRRNSTQEDKSPAIRSYHTGAREWEESYMEIPNPLLFNVFGEMNPRFTPFDPATNSSILDFELIGWLLFEESIGKIVPSEELEFGQL
jgi:hypothetical protein